jgi:hypothetical protein
VQTFLFIEPNKALKELRVKGAMNARKRVSRAIYDVIVGDTRFHSVVVSEAHVNSSVPGRTLTLECAWEAFKLEDAIRKQMDITTNKVTFEPTESETSSKANRSEVFEITARSLYAYLVVHGVLADHRSLHRKDEILMLLHHVSPNDWREGLCPFDYYAACATFPPNQARQASDEFRLTGKLEAQITLAGKPGRIEKSDNKITITTVDNSDFADSLASLLATKHRCIIPLLLTDACKDQKPGETKANAFGWEKVRYDPSSFII